MPHRAAYKNNTYVLDYAVWFDGLVHDDWVPVVVRPCHHLGCTDDALDSARDNMTFFSHRLRQNAPLVVMTRDMPSDKHGFDPYGGPYRCHDMYPLVTQIRTVRR